MPGLLQPHRPAIIEDAVDAILGGDLLALNEIPVFVNLDKRERECTCRGFAHTIIDQLKSGRCPFGYLGGNHRTILGNSDKIIFDLRLVPALASVSYTHLTLPTILRV